MSAMNAGEYLRGLGITPGSECQKALIIECLRVPPVAVSLLTRWITPFANMLFLDLTAFVPAVHGGAATRKRLPEEACRPLT
jgi:hypothetical protein